MQEEAGHYHNWCFMTVDIVRVRCNYDTQKVTALVGATLAIVPDLAGLMHTRYGTITHA